jgi:hypothetical protein
VSAVRAGSWLLSPTDPLFPEITAVYLKVQTQLLGTDHMYNADTFNGARPYTHSGGLRVLYISCLCSSVKLFPKGHVARSLFFLYIGLIP